MSIFDKREEELEEALKDMVLQFGYQYDGLKRRPPSLGTGGLSALESAFDLLGWNDPYPMPEASCDIVGCQKWTQAGVPFPNGDYLRLCSEHSAEHRDGIDLLAKKRQGRGYNAKERKERLERFKSYAHS